MWLTARMDDMGRSDGLHVSLGDLQMIWMGGRFMFQISILSISVTFRKIDFARSLLKYSYDEMDYHHHTFNLLFFEFGK
jgi:hypothetical protein